MSISNPVYLYFAFLGIIQVANCKTNISAVFAYEHDMDCRSDHTVYLKRNKKDICIGSVLTRKLILTAARCMDDDTNPTENITILHYYSLFNIRKVIIHPKYTGSPYFYNDIAIVELSEELPSPTSGIRLQLPFKDCNEPICPEPKFIGYNRLHYRFTCIPIMSMISKEECEEMMRVRYIFIEKKPLGFVECSYKNSSDVVNVCRNDIGGALLCNNDNSSTLEGIASIGHDEPCDRNRYPTAYTKLSCYLKFILKTVKDSGDEAFFDAEFVKVKIDDVENMKDEDYPKAEDDDDSKYDSKGNTDNDTDCNFKEYGPVYNKEDTLNKANEILPSESKNQAKSWKSIPIIMTCVSYLVIIYYSL